MEQKMLDPLLGASTIAIKEHGQERPERIGFF